LRKMLNVQCPCGYRFKTFGSINDAIAIIKLHVESFHKDFLPFGITNDEALTLFNQGQEEIESKISKRTAYSAQTEPIFCLKNTTSSLQSFLDRLLGEDIEVETKTERKKTQLTA
jgi:hypothetical protein